MKPPKKCAFFTQYSEQQDYRRVFQNKNELLNYLEEGRGALKTNATYEHCSTKKIISTSPSHEDLIKEGIDQSGGR